MNIEYFREFNEAARSLSFTATAKKLNVSQPALSKHIATLEKDLGVRLFIRGKRDVQLTEAGRSIFDLSGKIVDSYDAVRVLAESLKMDDPIHIVGHLGDLDVSALASMVAMIARETYKVPIVFDRIEVKNPRGILEEEGVDLFIGYADIEGLSELGLAFEPIISNRLVAIAENSHPFASKESIGWEDLKNETLIKFVNDSTNPAWNQIESLCSKHGFLPQTRSISSLNDVEFFSTPLLGNILIWKKTQRQIGLLLETGQRVSIPFDDDDAKLTMYAVFAQEDRERLSNFLDATRDAVELIESRRHRLSSSASDDA